MGGCDRSSAPHVASLWRPMKVSERLGASTAAYTPSAGLINERTPMLERGSAHGLSGSAEQKRTRPACVFGIVKPRKCRAPCELSCPMWWCARSAIQDTSSSGARLAGASMVRKKSRALGRAVGSVGVLQCVCGHGNRERAAKTASSIGASHTGRYLLQDPSPLRGKAAAARHDDVRHQGESALWPALQGGQHLKCIS